MIRNNFNTSLGINIFIDCGAPSLYNKLSKQTQHKGIMGASFKDRKYDKFGYTETPEYKEYRENYMDFLLENKQNIDVYSNLDVINNPSLTYKNQMLMEEAGLRPIPVFHLGSDIKWLKMYLRKYEYIAIGGLIPNPTTVLIPILDKLFKEHLLDSQGFPKVKLHGFACTSLRLMQRYPWYSVDSATARKLAAYGGVNFPTHREGEMSVVYVSSRDVPLEKRISPGILAAMDERCARFNMTLKELSETPTARQMWNYFIMLEQLTPLPKWPWSMQTRQTLKGTANPRHLHFYYAGSNSKKEEILMWQKMDELGFDPDRKRRLATFFYKSEAEYIIGKK